MPMMHEDESPSGADLADAFGDEEKKMRRLRIIVDLAAAVLAQEKLTIDEALDLMNATRRTVLQLFPGKERAYDMIYSRRFARIIRERFGQASDDRQKRDADE